MGDLDVNLMRWAMEVGGPMMLLVMVGGYIYRKDNKSNVERAEAMANQYRADMKDYADQMRVMNAELIVVIKENTAAFAKNAEVIQSLHSHIIDGERRRELR